MLDTPVTSRRSIAFPDGGMTPSPEQAELLLHTLAQLSSEFEVVLPEGLPNRTQLALTAKAYGLENQVSFQRASRAGRAVGPSVRPDITLAEMVEELSGSGGGDSPHRRGDDEVFRGHRIALVTNLPTHYRVPLLNALAARIARGGGQLRVLFCAQDAASRPWLTDPEALECEHAFLQSVVLPIRARPPLVPRKLEAALRSFRPTIVLSAGFSPAVTGRVARYARVERVPFAIWSGEHEAMATARSRVRTVVRRRLLAQARCAIAYGSASARYMRRLAPDLPIVIGRNTAPLPAPPAALGQGQTPIQLVAIGDLADARKGIDLAIDALNRRPNLACRLCVIGGGPMFSELRKRASSDARIELSGARSPEETRRSLSAAQVFVFPTRADIFGLALVEAMGAGLCSLVSPVAGAVADLCVNGVNCLVVPHETEDWASSIEKVVSDTPLRNRLGACARSTVLRRWTIDHAADAMIAGLRLAVLEPET